MRTRVRMLFSLTPTDEARLRALAKPGGMSGYLGELIARAWVDAGRPPVTIKKPKKKAAKVKP